MEVVVFVCQNTVLGIYRGGNRMYVPKEKMSKKAQKEANARERRTWGTISPVTRVKQSAKKYNRNKDKQSLRGCVI